MAINPLKEDGCLEQGDSSRNRGMGLDPEYILKVE